MRTVSVKNIMTLFLCIFCSFLPLGDCCTAPIDEEVEEVDEEEIIADEELVAEEVKVKVQKKRRGRKKTYVKKGWCWSFCVYNLLCLYT